MKRAAIIVATLAALSSIALAAGSIRDWGAEGEGSGPWLVLIVGGVVVVTLASTLTMVGRPSMMRGALIGLAYGSAAGALFTLTAADSPDDAWALPLLLAALAGAGAGAVCGVIAFGLAQVGSTPLDRVRR